MKGCFVIIYNAVYFYRKHYKMTQTDLAKLCGVSKNTISSIERYEFTPSLELSFKLSHILKIPIDKLFSYVDG